MPSDPLATARAAIERAHAADPEREAGHAAESLYAERIEVWVRRLVPAPTEALQLAARCQHLERWAIARDQYPADRAGYLRWRRAAQQRQGERATELLRAAGCAAPLVERVARLVAKAVPLSDPEAQALEDAACLVFLDHELDAFAAEHPDYGRDKWLGILRKTWAKMSDAARSQALALELKPEFKELIAAALAP